MRSLRVVRSDVVGSRSSSHALTRFADAALGRLVLDDRGEPLPSRRNTGSTLFTVVRKALVRSRVLPQLATAPRTVLLTPRLGNGCFTLVLITLMIRPLPRCFIPGTTARTSVW